VPVTDPARYRADRLARPYRLPGRRGHLRLAARLPAGRTPVGSQSITSRWGHETHLLAAAVCSAQFRVISAIMDDVPFCDLCEMDRSYCVHGLGEHRRAVSASVSTVLVSPSGIAHFPQCPHKGDDPDYSRWAEIDTPNAWERLGNGDQLSATGGSCPDLIVKGRCLDCIDHGPW